MTPKYHAGTEFITRGKVTRHCTVVDIHTTINLAGDVVKVRYVATHKLMGQVVTDYEVHETTVAMGLMQATA